MIAIIEAMENDKNKEIVTEWYIEYNKLMLKIAYDIVGDYHIANDMVNEAFIKIIKNFSKIFGFTCSQRAVYFVSTIRSVSIDYLRKHKKEIKLIDFDENKKDEIADIPSGNVDVYEIVEKAENIKKLTKLMDELSPRDRELVICKFVYDMSEQEISDQLAISRKNVHVYVKRAVDRLIKLVERSVKDEEK